jgi:hypothetical protein
MAGRNLDPDQGCGRRPAQESCSVYLVGKRQAIATMPGEARDLNGCSGGFFSHPLFRLLAINLVSGIAVALLLVGILLLNPHRIRDLLFADAHGGLAIVLIGFGFIVTFGSVAMGSAIMALGRSDRPHSGKFRRNVENRNWQAAMRPALRHVRGPRRR